MPKVSDEHREMMRERIREAAMRKVVEKGFAATSMADIIAEADLSAGAVYIYYKSKEELLVDLGKNVLADRIEAMTALRTSKPVPAPSEALPGFISALVEHPFFPGIAVQVWGEAVHREDLQSTAREVMSRISAAMGAYLAAWFVEARGMDGATAQRQAELLTPSMLGLVQGFMIQESLTGGGRQELYLASMRGLLENL